MFSPDQWAASTGVSFYNNVATQSLRYNDDDNPYLSKTFSAGNAKTWTWSGWVKLSSTTVSNSFIYSQLSSGADVSWLYFTSNNQLNMQSYEGGNQLDIKTNAKFRDTSAWYHIMAVLDTTQSISTDRAKMYVNGELQTSLANTTYPSQNADLKFNNGDAPVLIGGTPDSYGTGAGYKLDGYLAEVNFVDGQALTPTSFGEFKNGVWIPKEYTGSYGTNGFRLQFNQTGTGTASSSTIGADTSGNANHFSSSGIVASDCDMPDSPENNFPTLNPLSSTGITYQEGNLEMSGSATYNAISTMGITEGKHYYEVLAFDNGSGGNLLVGIIDEDFLGTQGNLVTNRGTYRSDGGITNLANSAVTSGSTYATGDFIGVAIDCDNGTVQFYKNNVAQGATPSFTFTAGTKVFANIRCDSSTTIANANFGQDSSFCGNTSVSGNTDADGFEFRYTPPTGFKAICAKNLPEPTIGANSDTQPDDYFNTVLYTGDSTSSNAITGVGFQPDWVWIKERNGTFNHVVQDSVRGIGTNSYLFLATDNTDAETSQTDGDGLLSLDTDGFTVGFNNTGAWNETGSTYVAWNWKAGGTAVSNTDGNITSSVSANTNAGFSIVSYTGNGTSGATIGHGLGVKPAFFTIKQRSGSNTNAWSVYHNYLGATKRVYLYKTDSAGTTGAFTSTEPTSTVFTLSNFAELNGSSETYIAYCFAEIEGYSKFGSYTGNGNADGTFVYTGFRPAWVLIKRTDSTGSWELYDDQRLGYNVDNYALFPNLNYVEQTDDRVDILSNGFKLRSIDGDDNASGGTYIYMSFAENPFKYSLGR